MNSDDPLRAALQRLLQATEEQPAGTPERRREVARLAGLNPMTLYQVATGVRLPSGAARSVGRPMRAKLDAAFPDWLNSGGAELHQQPVSSEHSELRVRKALGIIRQQLAAISGQNSEEVAEALKLLALVPDSDRAFEQAINLLTTPR